MKHIISIIILSVLLFFFSCEKTEFPEAPSILVIEGYIDDGGFPIVMVTTTVPISTESQNVENLSEHLLRWATVSISDGENKVFLTGRIDNSYFPPYIYTTSRMRGQSGKTYTLNVEYGDYNATASTTIPPCPTIDSIKVEPTAIDSLCKVSLCFTDNSEEKNYYKIFTKKGIHSKQWLSSNFGLINDEILHGYTEYAVNQGSIITDTTTYTPFFNYSDTLSIKFATIDNVAYNYWYDYENYANLSENPLFPVINNLSTNISGGIGCWYGCGSAIVHIPLCGYKPSN